MHKKDKPKYIFITGGVVSSLGKGITAASIGLILKSKGLKVNMLKLDPYLNVDPGTMSPYQHGEVFVTEDGAETDLDIGHYERFLNVNMKRENNVTAGQIYKSVIEKERLGFYLGKTIQVVPHITDEIKERIKNISINSDLVITEIGGTVGDIEGLPFLEAARQFSYEYSKKNVLYIHITLVPYIKAADELKTKPTQQSVSKLREIGILPDIILCRTEKELPESIKEKISLFCNVPIESVIEEKDVGEFIYRIPIELEKQKLGDLILKMLGIKKKKTKLKEWEKLLSIREKLKDSVNIGIVGKYTEVKDAYKSICEALIHSSIKNNVLVKIIYIDTKEVPQKFENIDGIIVPGGFGERGIEGKIQATKYAREKKIPFLGICLGMQCAIIEFARNVLGLKKANSTEFVPTTPYPIISLMEEQKNIKKYGGTMRLGVYPCNLKQNSIAHKAYSECSSSFFCTKQAGELVIYERHRHRYELNNKYREILEKNGMEITGEYREKYLAEIIELKNHPWFVATQFHPEFNSRPLLPHPLFVSFVKKCLQNKY